MEGRGWGKALCKGGQASPGRMEENITFYPTGMAYINTTENMVTLRCGCDPDKAGGHKYRGRRCGEVGRKCVISSYMDAGCAPAFLLGIPIMKTQGNMASGAPDGVPFPATGTDKSRNDDDNECKEGNTNGRGDERFSAGN